jgi:hypothetical protein
MHVAVNLLSRPSGAIIVLEEGLLQSTNSKLTINTGNINMIQMNRH